MTYEEKLPHALFTGFNSILSCDACGAEFWIEDDVSNGEEVECDMCQSKLEVAGR